VVSCTSKGNYASETLDVIRILNWRVCGEAEGIGSKEVPQLHQCFLADKIHCRQATRETQQHTERQPMVQLVLNAVCTKCKKLANGEERFVPLHVLSSPLTDCMFMAFCNRGPYQKLCKKLKYDTIIRLFIHVVFTAELKVQNILSKSNYFFLKESCKCFLDK
jgi:hypothetical protein